MWKQFYSNSGLILIAVLGIGIWVSNALSFIADKSAPKYTGAAVGEVPTPTPSFEELLEKERQRNLTADDRRRIWKQIKAAEQSIPTARCNDGTFTNSQNRQGACSQHGGVAQWLSH